VNKMSIETIAIPNNTINKLKPLLDNHYWVEQLRRHQTNHQYTFDHIEQTKYSQVPKQLLQEIMTILGDRDITRELHKIISMDSTNKFNGGM
jgi:hypothetical protein